MSKPLSGKVALVTGASRGIGRGIAVELAAAGALVYITCRPYSNPERPPTAGTIEDVEKEIKQRYGRCVIAECDHSKPAEVEKLFARIEREQRGRLDVLVNNAYDGVGFIFKRAAQPFYAYNVRPEAAFDASMNVGLRNNYVCSVYAAKLMVKRGTGVIIQISSVGSLQSLFDVSYGMAKVSLDKMAAHMALDLRGTGVTVLSVHPGPVETEQIVSIVTGDGNNNQEKARFAAAETIYGTGRALVPLLSDPRLHDHTGRTIASHQLAEKYGVRDVNGKELPRVYSGELKRLLEAEYQCRMMGQGKPYGFLDSRTPAAHI